MDSNKESQLQEDLLDGNQLETDELEQLQNDQKMFDYHMSMQSEQTKRKSCCLVFSLQTGVMMIVITDVIIFSMICAICGMTAESFDYGHNSKGMGFTIMTDGVCVFLFGIRLLYGLWYVKKVVFPPKMDYQYIVEFGKLKWHTKRVKDMRINFKNYVLASNVTFV